MKAIIIYNSKTGFTERYAGWLAKQLNCETVRYRDRNKTDLIEYDTVIYAGSVHAGLIRGLKWFKKQLPLLEGKKKIVLAVGAMPAGEEMAANVASANFTQEELGDIRLFYLPGGLCYEKMGVFDRLFMKLFRKMLASRKNPSAEEAETAKAISHSYDIADRAYLEPVVDAFMQGADF